MSLSFEKAPRVMIVEARFYDHIADYLLEGTKEALDSVGATYDVYTVPGALEIPAAVKFALDDAKGCQYDAFVALGTVIRGETTHYETVANESSRGLMDLTISHNVALGNGILTVENEAQALDRAMKDRKNKGGGAAMAALEMLALKLKFGGVK